MMGNGDAANVGQLPLWLCDMLADIMMSPLENGATSRSAKPIAPKPLSAGPLRLELGAKEKKRQYTLLLAQRENLASRYRSLTGQRRMREAAAVQAELRVITHKIMKWKGTNNV